MEEVVPGRFGRYGGRYVAETLIPALDELERAYAEARGDAGFEARRLELLEHYVGRPTALYHAERIGAEVGLSVWLKREDLCHTGAHKVNNTDGSGAPRQAHGQDPHHRRDGGGAARRRDRDRLRALRPRPARSTWAPRTSRRQAPNVRRMHLLGAQVHQVVTSGSKTLKDAMNEALRDWVTNVRTTHYCVGSVAGPAPLSDAGPRLSRTVIGREARELRCSSATGAAPATRSVACVGGGSNAMGLFAALPRRRGRRGSSASRRLGDGLIQTDRHAATLT